MQAASAKIESFNPQNLKALRAEMDEALKSVAAKYGVAIRTGNARYTAENTTFKIDISTVSNGVVIDKSAADFTRYCGGYGLKPEHLGAAITFNGERYTIKGLASGRSHNTRSSLLVCGTVKISSCLSPLSPACPVSKSQNRSVATSSS